MRETAPVSSERTTAAATLPLLESALLVWSDSVVAAPLVQIALRALQPLTPTRALEAGEQYRFHFDMTKCIGCKCCVVACNEQNGNPAAINWRRVGEIEGGYYPFTQRFHLSMGCNHCLEPSCLIGCPVEAYTKDPRTGVVILSADTCIGCQYCTWNCSYGVPQYDAARGTVGKCDMCHHRLADGMAPACVNACPEGAIQVEIFNVAEWRREHVSANAPGLPSADDSVSTTRITLPENLVPSAGRVDLERVEPEHPHWPLVFMLVLTQLSVGAFGVLWMLDLLGQGAALSLTAVASLGLAGMSLGASTLHLGRPVYAWCTLKGLRRSWLSREVLTLSLFAASASAFAGMLLFNLPARPLAGAVTLAAGIAGVFSSARIYTVRARPAWYSHYTLAEFFSTAALLGPLFVQLLTPSSPRWVAAAALAGASAQLFTQMMKFLWLSRSETFELRASSLLLSGRLRNLFLVRLGMLALGGIIVPMGFASIPWAALPLALGGEWLGRYLFFVSVVPKNLGAAFTSGERVAA